MRARVLLSISALVVLCPSVAGAQDARPQMQVSWPVDGAITGVGAAAWLVTELAKGKLAADPCRWCDPPGLDVSARDSLRWSNTKGADSLSNLTGYALGPLMALGLDAAAVWGGGGDLEEWGKDALVIAEAIAISADLNQLVKLAAGRERPYVHALPAGEKAGAGSDRNLSFYSGHTALGFSGAVAAGTIASLKGYRAAPLIWATGLSMAGLTGYLRIAADRHYLLDVLAGALMGSAVGAVVPLLHRPAAPSRGGASALTVAPAAGGATFGLQGTW